MTMDRIFTVAGAIVTLAIVATLVGSSNTAGVVNSVMQGFSGSIRAAKGA